MADHQAQQEGVDSADEGAGTEGIPHTNAGRRIRTGAFSEFAFMITGGALTVAAFLFSNIFIDRLVKAEYARAAQNAVMGVAERFQDMERAVNTAAVILAANPNEMNLFSKVQGVDADISGFDQIMLLFPADPSNPASPWQYKNVYQRSGDAVRGAYGVKPDAKFLSYVISNKYAETNAPQAMADADFFQAQAGTKAQGSDPGEPFALARALDKGGTQKYVMVAAGQAGMILSDVWMSQHPDLERLTIRDPQSGYTLFHYVRDGAGSENPGGEVYEFSFGGRHWETRAEYAMDMKTSLMQSFPFFVMLFGFLMTTAGTLYIHGSRRYAARAEEINEVLEHKNKELETEAAKREKLNAMLKKSERENRSIIDSVNDIIFETDTKGKILFLNAAWRKITGFDPEQSKGLDFIAVLHPQDQEKQRKDFQLLVRGQKQTYRSFTRLRTSDGTFRAVELSISMMRQDENRNLRVVGAMTDVEERRRAERALGEAEKKYRTIVENAAGGIFQLTPEGVYLSANPAFGRILGYADADDLLRNVKNANDQIYFNQRERQYFLKELENVGAISNYETQVVRKDGKRIWVNENVRAVKDESGASLYYEGSLEDISQRKDAEMGLREAKIHSDLANRAKSEFLANMSHELRTPLNSIIGFSEILKNEIFGPLGQDSYKEYVRDIFESGKKLLTVINEILDISRIEAGDRHLNEQIVDIYAVAAASMKLLDNKIKANNLVVMNQLKDVPKIVGEELAIKQILVNILSNAVKFTPGGGRVMITNETDAGGNLRISITDTGIGLDESEIEKALSPFGQVDSALSRAGAGTGLGLTLVNALVKLHDGKLELFSQKGIGTTVTVVFPADRVAKQKQGAAHTVKPQPYKA